MITSKKTLLRCNTCAVKCTLNVIISCILTVLAVKTAVIFVLFSQKYDLCTLCKILATISRF